MNPHTLILIDELAAHLDDADLLVVDCRKELSDPDSGRLAHAEAHIPGAIYADLDIDLSDLSRRGLGRHPLPDQEAFSATLSRWGWRPGMRVVAYDDAGGALAAARLWWMLRLIGERDVSVLDGGFSAWHKAGLPLESSIAAPVGNTVSVRFDQHQLVDVGELQQGLADTSLLLLDARAAPRYRGDVEPLDAVAGHVPGALNRPFSDNLDAGGHFKSATRLREEYLGLIGAHAVDQIVHMCGSGVTACHNLLAMEHAGLAGSRLFAPSWSGWISDPARPVATGS
jgi:thiosulfate/3-mercaptopyruvate sulfurtransferase